MDNRKQFIKVTGVLFALVFLIQGCQSSKDTSGYKLEKQMSKAEIQQNIEQIKNNRNVPEVAKNLALADLQRKLEKTK